MRPRQKQSPWISLWHGKISFSSTRSGMWNTEYKSDIRYYNLQKSEWNVQLYPFSYMKIMKQNWSTLMNSTVALTTSIDSCHHSQQHFTSAHRKTYNAGIVLYISFNHSTTLGALFGECELCVYRPLFYWDLRHAPVSLFCSILYNGSQTPRTGIGRLSVHCATMCIWCRERFERVW